DLSELLPDAAGRLEASGRVDGPLPRVRVDASIEARGLAFEDHRLASLDVAANVDLGGEQRSTLSVIARDGLVADNAIGLLTLDGAGTAEGHSISLALEAEPGNAALRIDGRLDDPWSGLPVWHFVLAEAELSHPTLAPWRLAGPASGSVDGERLALERHCWQADRAELCLEARRDDTGLAAELELDELSFGYFDAFLPEDMQLRGSVSASALVAQAAGETLTADA